MTLERKTVHISDDTGRIAMYEYRTAGWDASPQDLIRYIYSNNLSSSMLELDDNGQIISYEEYHPFGTTAYQATNASINAVAKRYRYTGKERDEESGLYYHGARYYIPWLCRWTQCDPIGIKDGLNVYAYCSNNPVMMHDPSGNGGEGNEKTKPKPKAEYKWSEGGSKKEEAKLATGSPYVGVTDSGKPVKKSTEKSGYYKGIDKVKEKVKLPTIPYTEADFDDDNINVASDVQPINGKQGLNMLINVYNVGVVETLVLFAKLGSPVEAFYATTSFVNDISNKLTTDNVVNFLNAPLPNEATPESVEAVDKIMGGILAVPIVPAVTEEVGNTIGKLANSINEYTSSAAIVEESSSVASYLKLFQPIDEFDVTTTLYRGTTGTEGSSSVMFLTNDPSVAATYIANGGQVMEYTMTNFSLNSLELANKLTKPTGINGIGGVVSTEYRFTGNDLVKALNLIGKPYKK